MKIGDNVAYMIHDVSSWSSTQIIGVGTIYFIDDKVIGIGRYQYSPQYIKIGSPFEECVILNNHCKEVFINILDNQINGLLSKIKSLTSEEKDEIIKGEFIKIKTQISVTCLSMLEATDDTRFINCLKELCRLKEKLFTIKVSDLENIHKQNGAIKAKIRQLEKLRTKVENFVFEI